MIYKTKGIVLRRINFGEADRLLTILTESRGKIRVVAKGVRKTLSHLAGHLEPFCVGNFLIAEGRNLDIVTGVTVEKCHLFLRNHLETTRTACYLAEIIDQMLSENQKHEEIFELLEETLDHLNTEPGNLLISYFEFNFLAELGFYPELEKCVHCGAKLTDENYFDFSGGGIICVKCTSKSSIQSAKPISIMAIKALRLFLKHQLSTIEKIKTDSKLTKEISNITSDYLIHINQKEFKSKRFLK